VFDQTADQTPRKILARKLVVLSAGAFATPQILERSGIDDAFKLNALGIETISDLAGVGMNLRDHPRVRGGTALVDARLGDTGDDIVDGDPTTLASLQSQFKEDKAGVLSWNFVDTAIKYRPTEDEVKALGTDFESYWTENFIGKPGKALISLQSFMM